MLVFLPLLTPPPYHLCMQFLLAEMDVHYTVSFTEELRKGRHAGSLTTSMLLKMALLFLW